MYETINEPIGELCRFTPSVALRGEGGFATGTSGFLGNKIIPEVFCWNNREHRILSVNSVHTSKTGTTKLVHFAISTNTSVYKIIFDKYKDRIIYSQVGEISSLANSICQLMGEKTTPNTPIKVPTWREVAKIQRKIIETTLKY